MGSILAAGAGDSSDNSNFLFTRNVSDHDPDSTHETGTIPVVSFRRMQFDIPIPAADRPSTTAEITKPANDQGNSRASAPFLPVLLLLFVGSGCAALIYEIVWFQLLQLVVGSSAVSLGLLLGTFMGGMCLGSLCLTRIVSPRRHPLRVYSLLELGIGLFGIMALFVVPYVAWLYVAGAGQGGILLRGAVG